MNVILSKIKSARKRMILGRAVHCLQICLLLGGCIALLLEVISLIVPFYYVDMAALIVLALSIVAAVVMTVIKLPDMTAAAKAVDGDALDSRVLTAYEFRNADDLMTVMQRKDAEKYAAAFNPKSIRVRIRVLPAILLALVLIFTGICVPINTIAKEKADNDHTLSCIKESVIKEIKEEAKETLDTYPDNEELETAVELLVKDTVATIKAAKAEQTVYKAQERFRVKLQELVDEYTRTPEEKALQEEIKEALKEVREEAESAGDELPDEYQSDIDEALSKAEEAIKEAASEEDIEAAKAEFEEKVNEAKKAAAGQNPTGDDTGETGSGQGTEGQQGGENQGSENQGSENQGSENQGGENQSGENQGSENQGNNGSQGSSENQGSGEGQQGSGEGQQGSGEGQQGSGEGQQGSGEGQQGQGQGSGEGQGSGQGNGQGSSGGQGWNYGSSTLIEKEGTTGESITYNQDTVDKYLNGTATEGSTGSTIKGQGGTTEGDTAAYSEVHAAYENQANNAMSDMELTEGMKEMIKEYFSETK